MAAGTCTIMRTAQTLVFLLVTGVAELLQSGNDELVVKLGDFESNVASDGGMEMKRNDEPDIAEQPVSEERKTDQAIESNLAKSNEITTHGWSMITKKFKPPELEATFEDIKIEAWYINNPSDVDRKDCMEKQLTDAGFAPHRFSALESTGSDDFDKCVSNGVEDMDADGDAFRHAVSNWCNHKRLFEGLQKLPTDTDYFLVFEDTPVINTKNLKKVVHDFIQDYRGKKWSFIQLDPYGGVGKNVGFHHEIPVFKPCDDMENMQAYQGTHALLVKTAALQQITGLMSRRKATRLEDLVIQIPTFLAVSAGVAINPIVNKFHEYLPLPAHCKAGEKGERFLQGEQERPDDDMWSRWPRENEAVVLSETNWWIPGAQSWVTMSLVDDRHDKSKEDVSEQIQAIQVGASDEDPKRVQCFDGLLRTAGFRQTPPQRMQLIKLPEECNTMPDGSMYQECLTKNGLEDCGRVGGQLSLADFELSVDWTRRGRIRDHVVAGTCTFKHILKQLETSRDQTQPYILLTNENVVLNAGLTKRLTQFIQEYKNQVWSAIQIDPYGREEPLHQEMRKTKIGGSVWSPSKFAPNEGRDAGVKILSDEEFKPRFWGLHAVLIKRSAIHAMLAEMADNSFGPADRIPRHTSGWLSANLGIAYDPHMATLTALDDCKDTISKSEHFRVSRLEIPESWGFVQKISLALERIHLADL
eukprot:gnl/MRDRNA2_/MRDRNA2_84306_c0_seq1.p1 gnl/MRDRNA2_/MRDRNA2_84306_c0~~gnl/MRDRNA2_/MRDRNA2_84306_c0_seq1.p1  ORF type:complete len:725 (-),score=140.63 gnl/MRDRNA2_/MRDRNA2_84306_c0_seq1:529-2625(-)